MERYPLSFPADDDAWLGFVTDYADNNLADAQRLMAELKDGTPRSSGKVLAGWNDVDIALQRAECLCGLVASVHPDEAVRDAADAGERAAMTLTTERDQDRGLYEVMCSIDVAELNDDQRRVLDHAVRDFRRAGVERPEDVRGEFARISNRCQELVQDFLRNIKDDVRSIRVAPDRLRGMPDDFLDSHPPEADGQVSLTTEYPDLFPIQMFAADHEVRRELCWAFENRGWPTNERVLKELLALRAEKARLLGFRNWPDYESAVNMAGSSSGITSFLDQLRALAEPVARREVAELLERRRVDQAGATTMRYSDQFKYYAELIRRERFGVDAARVRRYFDYPKVQAGILEVTARLFGLEYRPVPEAAVWHADASTYDVHERSSGERLGRLYLDMHPRPGKYSHAALYAVTLGIAERNLPEVALVCNFPRGLLSHSDVRTFLHELGHGLHFILSGSHDWVNFSCGFMELDFAETPSQMLEEWAWLPAVLETFAVDETGAAISPDLVRRMRAAEEFGKGVDVMHLVVLATIAHQMHLRGAADPSGVVADVQRDCDVFEQIPDTHMHAGFTHLAEYGASYYTYAWSLIIAKDLFSAFDVDDPFAATIASRYRDRILMPGGSRPADTLVENFLDRPRSFEPFRNWLSSRHPD